MSIQTQSLAGFSVELGERIESFGIGLTRGTNFFDGFALQDPDRIQDETYLLDEGYQQLPGFRHVHVNWNFRFVTSRTTRKAALEALSSIAVQLVQKRTERMDSFRILTTRIIQSPIVTQVLPSKRLLAECVVQFQVIPKG